MEHLKPETKENKLLSDFIDEARAKYKGNDDETSCATISALSPASRKSSDPASKVARTCGQAGVRQKNDSQIKDAHESLLKVTDMVRSQDKVARAK